MLATVYLLSLSVTVPLVRNHTSQESFLNAKINPTLVFLTENKYLLLNCICQQMVVYNLNWITAWMEKEVFQQHVILHFSLQEPYI